MKNSSSRILTTHVGSLARPPEIIEVMRAKEAGQTYDAQRLAGLVRDSVQEVVRRQVEAGIDVPSDGEYGKPSFTAYVHDRLTGFEPSPSAPREASLRNAYRDRMRFPEFYAEYDSGGEAAAGSQVVCTGPITYQGQEAVQSDISNFKAALETAEPEEAFIPAVAPGTIELQRSNVFYATEEEFLAAIADAMKEEYRAIVDAGFILQVDDPRVVTHYGNPDPAPTIEEYRKFASLRVAALNHALEGIPADRVRYHLCWGSWHGPHTTDVPLRDIVDIVLQVNAGAYCVEAANPRHAHEWEVWENVKLPDGKILIPGVVAHTTNHVEHPELVAQRIVNYARMLGRENVMAGSDCGFSQGAFTPRVHPSIMWAKLEALAQGAALASQQLWS
jgi:5-methyltetrahydropteroyltriglutamate--homocysteine methyltransferase